MYHGLRRIGVVIVFLYSSGADTGDGERPAEFIVFHATHTFKAPIVAESALLTTSLTCLYIQSILLCILSYFTSLLCPGQMGCRSHYTLAFQQLIP